MPWCIWSLSLSLRKFAKNKNSCFNRLMKSLGSSVKNKLIAKYLEKDNPSDQAKSTDINILLNRIQMNKKNDSRKKLFFSAAASTGLILFGLIIF